MTIRRTVEMVVLVLLLAAPTKAQERANGKRSLVAREESRQGQKKSEPAREDPTYLIGPEDVLDISVWKEPNVSRVVPVRPDGKISLPLLNDVQAAGLTPSQLGYSITERLRKYITDPQVTVTVTAINSQRVYVVGEVNRPGPIPLLLNMTVLQVLASAGGFTQFANQKRIYVIRNVNGKQERLSFDYKQAIRGDVRQNIIVTSGDTIVVP